MDRLSAARERVRQVKAELRSPAVEYPCINCRYFEIVCTHPAASEIKVSPVSGKAKADYPAADKVRAPDGACGPEGILFDERTRFGLAVVSVLRTPVSWWVVFFLLAALGDSLLR